METRSTRNLENVNIHDLLMEAPISQNKTKRRRVRTKISRSKQHNSLAQRQATLIDQQNVLIARLQEKQLRQALPTQEKERVNETLTTFLLFDTESFKFQFSNSKNKILLPLQFAYGVYNWTGTELDCLARSTMYLSEIITSSRCRKSLKKQSERCFKRHEENMKSANYPLVTAAQLFNRLHDVIITHNVDTIVAYNISWDFESLRNVMSLFNVEHDSFCSQSNNPFNPMRLHYLDLMHQTVKLYGRELIKNGIQDGTVHRAQTSKRIMLRRGFGKSVFSAQYVLQLFFNVSQKHLAQDDVDDEALLLEKILQDFNGADKLELNICYPQQSCFRRMVNIAHELYPVVGNPIIEEAAEEAKDECLFVEYGDE